MSKKTVPHVAIVTLNWKGAADTLALLNDLERVLYPNFSVLIVDNASPDDSVKQIEQYIEKLTREKNPFAKQLSLLVLSENFGFAEGNNRAILHLEAKQPDYYLLLNNDTLLDPNFLSLLIDRAGSNPRLAAVGPTIYSAKNSGEKTETVWFAGSWINFFAGGAHHNVTMPENYDEATVLPAPFITGCCLLLKRTALDRVGQLFDPAYYLYSEDVDLSLRLTQAGFELGYVPSATIWHKLATSSGGPKSYNFWYYNVRNSFLLVSRYGKWYHFIVYFLYFLLYNPVLLSLVGAIIKPRPDKWPRLAAITKGTVDFFFGRLGKKD